jgi:hypothetical protein
VAITFSLMARLTTSWTTSIAVARGRPGASSAWTSGIIRDAGRWRCGRTTSAYAVAAIRGEWSWPRPIQTEAEMVFRLLEAGKLESCRFNGINPIESELAEKFAERCHQFL